MSKLSPSQQNACLKIIQKLISWPICSPFVLMDNKEFIDSTSYVQSLNKPMSLFDVKINLTLNKYDSIQAWEDDVNKIWSNAKLYYGRNSINYRFANQAKQMFEEEMKNFPGKKNNQAILF